METTEKTTQQEQKFGIATHALAGVCHNCGICKFANKKPESTFGKTMAWHRTWCPAWASHTKKYGIKSLS